MSTNENEGSPKLNLELEASSRLNDWVEELKQKSPHFAEVCRHMENVKASREILPDEIRNVLDTPDLLHGVLDGDELISDIDIRFRESELTDEQKICHINLEDYFVITSESYRLAEVKRAYHEREDLSDEVKHVLDEIIRDQFNAVIKYHKPSDEEAQTAFADGFIAAMRYLGKDTADFYYLADVTPNRESVEVKVQ